MDARYVSAGSWSPSRSRAPIAESRRVDDRAQSAAPVRIASMIERM
jgi:hypothetical protein